MNAIFFYHYMEFTSDIPPENLIPYFSVEGPYILSMALIVYKGYVASKLKMKKDDDDMRPRATSKSDFITVRRSDDKRYDAQDSEKNGKKN